MGFQGVGMFIDSFMDDVAYARDVKVCMYSMICYIPGCICYGSENFVLGSVHDDCVGLAERNTLRYFHIACKFEKIASVNCVHGSYTFTGVSYSQLVLPWCHCTAVQVANGVRGSIIWVLKRQTNLCSLFHLQFINF